MTSTQDQSFLERPLTATCECTAVQLTLPPPTTGPQANYLCHCLVCRKLGSLFAWQLRYPSTSVKVTRGEESLTKYSTPTDEIDPETGEKPFMAFCKVCGNSMFGTGHGDIVVRGGALDLEGNEYDQVREWIEGEQGREKGWWPKYEFFTKRKPSWFKLTVEGAVQRQELQQ